MTTSGLHATQEQFAAVMRAVNAHATDLASKQYGRTSALLHPEGRSAVAAAIAESGIPVLPGPGGRWTVTVAHPEHAFFDIVASQVPDSAVADAVAHVLLDVDTQSRRVGHVDMAARPVPTPDGLTSALRDREASGRLRTYLQRVVIDRLDHGPYASDPPASGDPASALLARLLLDQSAAASTWLTWTQRAMDVLATAIAHPHLIEVARVEARLAARQQTGDAPMRTVSLPALTVDAGEARARDVGHG